MRGPQHPKQPLWFYPTSGAQRRWWSCARIPPLARGGRTCDATTGSGWGLSRPLLGLPMTGGGRSRVRLGRVERWVLQRVWVAAHPFLVVDADSPPNVARHSGAPHSCREGGGRRTHATGTVEVHAAGRRPQLAKAGATASGLDPVLSDACGYHVWVPTPRVRQTATRLSGAAFSVPQGRVLVPPGVPFLRRSRAPTIPSTPDARRAGSAWAAP